MENKRGSTVLTRSKVSGDGIQEEMKLEGKQVKERMRAEERYICRKWEPIVF